MTTLQPDDPRSRVLLVDDAPDIHKLFSMHLRELPIELLHAYSGSQALLIASQHRPRLILLDYHMPDLDGMAVLRALKGDERLASIPVMLVTAADDLQTVADAFSLGAADYLRKPVCGAEVKARVGAALRVQTLLEQLRRQAYHDGLTGLPNRTYLAARLEHAIARKRSTPDSRFAVLFFDFDRFKNVNDSLGHTAGDQLLQQIASRFLANLRITDGADDSTVVARIGGDEFVVLLENMAAPQDASSVALRLLDAFSHSYRIGEHEVFSSASVGIVTSELGHTSVDELLRDADTAMYEAKAAGKGCHVTFNRSMGTRAKRRLSIEVDLHRAIDRGEFFLMYQPILSLRTGSLESVEALIRWQHPALGLVLPDQFIGIAEETGLIVPIGEWVLHEACRQLAEWQPSKLGQAPSRISVNLSRRQLLAPSFASCIDGVASSYGISPRSLMFEVTETEMMHDVVTTRKVLHGIRELGAGISMDDFGTGHSSLACLRDFPLTALKMDRSFVANIGAGRDLVAVISAIVDLARDLGIQTVAEGIETLEQLVSLQALNCDYGQGYYLSRPLLAAAVPTVSVPSLQP